MTIAAEDDRALRPRNFNEYVGQKALTDRLKVHIDAARKSGRRMEHVLLTSPPGMGKTSLANIIASQLRQPIWVTARPLTASELMMALYSFDGRQGCVFLDEIHRWAKRGAGQEMLLPLLEEQQLDTPYGREDFPNITVIAASTEAQGIIPPLSERFGVVPFFQDYTDDDLMHIVRVIARKAGVPMSADEAFVLGRAAGGVPRAARNFVLAARDLEESTGTRPTAAEVLAFCQVDEDALTRMHLEYLACLLEFGGRTGLDNLSTRLRMHPAAIEDLERLLLNHKLVEYGSSGRSLTPAGRSRLKGVIAPAVREEREAS